MLIKLTQIQFEWTGTGTEPSERPITIMADKIKTWAPKVMEDQEMIVTEITFVDRDSIYVKQTPDEVDAKVLLLDDRTAVGSSSRERAIKADD